MKKNRFLLLFLFIIVLACTTPRSTILLCAERARDDFIAELQNATHFSIAITTDKETFSGPDEVINYTIEVANTGEAVIHNEIKLIDSLLNLTCEGGYAGGFTSYNTEFCGAKGAKPDFDWLDINNAQAGGLQPGESFLCEASYTTTEEDVQNGMVENITSGKMDVHFMVYYNYNDGGRTGWSVWSETTRMVKANFSIEESAVKHVVPFAPNPSISLAKSVTPEYYSGGETVTYVYEITNTGNAPLYEPFTIKDDLVDDVFCPGGFVLQPGQTFPCEATYFISPGLRWTITNNAQAFTSLDGLSIESNIASASVNYRQPEVVPEKEATLCPPGVCD